MSKYYLTPTGMLSGTWIIFILLKWIIARDLYFSNVAALYFVLFIFSFFLGEFLIYVFINLNPQSILKKFTEDVNISKDSEIYKTSKIHKAFGNTLLILGGLTVIGAILYVQQFIAYFGSLVNVLTAGWAVRGALEFISIPIFTRMILMLGYSAIVLSLIYHITYRKFRWFLLLPYISLLIMGITQAGRAGFMMILFQIFIASFWRQVYENMLSANLSAKISLYPVPEWVLLKRSLQLIIVIAIVFLGGDMLRSQSFGLSNEVMGSGLLVFKEYLFGGIAGFSSYIAHSSVEPIGWGKYSFSSLYELLGIAKNELGVYTTYLRISYTDYSKDINIFTAFRQYMDDFGTGGTMILMIIWGAISYVFFKRATKGDLGSISFMIVLYTFLFHTVLLSITVHNAILVSFIAPFFIMIFLKKLI